VVSNKELNKCTHCGTHHTEKYNCDGSAKNEYEVIVKLADGCTVKSGSEHRTAGDYIRICDENNKEIAYWHFDEWRDEPTLVMGAIINFMAGKRIPKSIDVIASGYEWECPNCDKLNTEMEIYNEVQCVKCNNKYTVDEAHHAYH